MASIVTTVTADDKPIHNEGLLRASLLEMLRPTDEVTLLSGAARSDSSLTLKNMVITLDGVAPQIPYRTFATDWGHGISAIQVPSEVAERYLSESEDRKRMIKSLVDSIPNELTSVETRVGPRLASFENRDESGDNWTAGFDGPTCCCGLYSAIEQQAPLGGTLGMRRAHKVYYLVAKAGSGRAGQEFHALLTGHAKQGDSLSTLCSQSKVTEAQMERVVAAGRRNRARLLLSAAEVLGMAPDVDSVPDHACCEDGRSQIAILLADSVTNVLENVGSSGGAADGSLWRYYAGSVAPHVSQGAIVCSTVSEGFVLYLPTSPDSGMTRIRNSALGAIPFGSSRCISTLEALVTATKAHRQTTPRAHPDYEWVRDHFGWTPATVRRTSSLPEGAQQLVENIEPAPLWGTNEPLDLGWERSIGVGGMHGIKLRPEIVALAGTESSTLRAAVASVL